MLSVCLSLTSTYLAQQSKIPVFESSTVLLGKVDTLDYARLHSYKELFTSIANKEKLSQDIFPRVINDLKLDLNFSKFVEQIILIPDPATFTLQVNARSSTPQTAIRISNALASEIQMLIKKENATQEQKARDLEFEIISNYVTRLSNSMIIQMTAAIVWGLLSGLLLALALEYFDDVINTKSEVIRTLGEQVAFLGTIPPDSTSTQRTKSRS